MPSQDGRHFLLKIGDGGSPQVFSTIAAARAVSLVLDNGIAENTAISPTASGIATYAQDAGMQSMQITLQGIFKDSAAEERLRNVAFTRSACAFELHFPNGDKYAASFAVAQYARGGEVDGLETFSATFWRSGAGVFTAGG